MGKFSDLEPRFRVLAGALQYLRLDFQWGAAGEHWSLTGMQVNSDVRHMQLLIESAGRQLVDVAASFPELHPYLSRAPIEAWYWALKNMSGEFQVSDMYGVQTDGGHIFTGSVKGVASASANLCLLLETRFPMPDKSNGDTYNITDSQIGILNTGQIANVKSIQVNLTSIRQDGDTELAEALEALTGAVQESDLDPDGKTDALEQLEELSRQAALPSEKRSKPSVLKAIAGSLQATITTAAGLAQVWTTWGPQIERFVQSLAS